MWEGLSDARKCKYPQTTVTGRKAQWMFAAIFFKDTCTFISPTSCCQAWFLGTLNRLPHFQPTQSCGEDIVGTKFWFCVFEKPNTNIVSLILLPKLPTGCASKPHVVSRQTISMCIPMYTIHLRCPEQRLNRAWKSVFWTSSLSSSLPSIYIPSTIQPLDISEQKMKREERPGKESGYICTEKISKRYIHHREFPSNRWLRSRAKWNERVQLTPQSSGQLSGPTSWQWGHSHRCVHWVHSAESIARATSQDD